MAQVIKEYTEEDVLKKQCATIRHYESLMVQLYDYCINGEHTADEYKEMILKSIWYQTMEDNK